MKLTREQIKKFCITAVHIAQLLINILPSYYRHKPEYSFLSEINLY